MKAAMNNSGGRLRRNAVVQFGVCATLLSVGFYLLYSYESHALSQYGAYAGFDILFDSDLPRVVDDLTNVNGDHYRTRVHPLFVILFNPIGVWMTKRMGSDLWASMKLTAVVGSLCPLLFFIYLRLLRLGLLEALLLALIYGVTACQLVWSAVPDTFIFAAATLLFVHVLFALALRGYRNAYWLLPLGGLAAISVTVTNYAQALIIFAGAAAGLARGQIDFSARMIQPAKWAVQAVAVSMVLAICLSANQKVMYPSSNEFYTVDAFKDEASYIRGEIWQAPRKVILTLGLNFGAYSIVGPRPEIVPLVYQSYSGIAFTNASYHQYRAGQWLVLFFWWGTLAYGIVVGLKEQRMLTLVLVGCLAFNIALHSIYATRYAFLYSAHQTFLQVALVGLGLSHLAGKGRAWRRFVLAELAGLLTLESYYNVHFMEEIAGLLEALS